MYGLDDREAHDGPEAKGISCGDVFKLDTGGNFSLVHSFTGADGQLPIALTIGAAGNLYGTTLGGGKSSQCTGYKGCGVVFEVSP